MATLDNNFKGKIAQKAAALAETVLNGFVSEAVHDGDVFLQQTENDLSEWIRDLAISRRRILKVSFGAKRTWPRCEP